MTMTLPAVINLHTTSHASDPRARGTTGSPGVGTKTNGNFPLTTNGMQMNNNTASSQTGAPDSLHLEFLATGGYDVSSDTRVFVGTWQYNAPNRLQFSDNANDGFYLQLGSGSASPPLITNAKRFRVGGRDKGSGSMRQIYFYCIDLNDTSHEAGTGFSNTDVQTYAFGCVRWDMIGVSTHLSFYQRCWAFETTKNASDIPRFTGTSDWDDLVDLVSGSTFTTKISDGWATREGNVYSFACPIEFGDNSVETDFNDNGAVVFWPDSNVTADPRVRVTSQAFRVYANLRDNAADTLTLSGTYNCGNSTPDWDFDLDFACTITIDGASFTNVGVFDMGSSVTGAATFNSCGIVNANHADVDLDGSAFRNPSGNHLLSLVP